MKFRVNETHVIVELTAFHYVTDHWIMLNFILVVFQRKVCSSLIRRKIETKSLLRLHTIETLETFLKKSLIVIVILLCCSKRISIESWLFD